MQVTEIIPIDKRRSKVRTDEGFAFALYGNELTGYRIEAGKELPEESYREICERVLWPRARERALHLLESRDRTEQEIRRKLAEGFYPPEIILRTVDFLRDRGLVDDWNYGRRYVEAYETRRSSRRIRQDLRRKGLTAGQIDSLTEGGEEKETPQITAYLRRHICDPETVSPEQRRKLTGNLLRKGYSHDAVLAAMKELGC